MALTIIDSNITKNSISVTFSEAVIADATNVSATNPANYTILAANSVDFAAPTTIQDSGIAASSSVSSNGTRVTFNFTASGGAKNEFQAGDSVSIVVRNIQSTSGDGLENGFAMISEVVGPVRRITRDVEDAISYPILTEEVAYRPSPVGTPTTGGGGAPGGSGTNLGQVAAKAVTDVLGWKVNTTDPKGFVGALTQAFTLNDVEGHVEATWTPRTYAVQTDLGGGITGAQASLYMRAKDALDKSLPLLGGLYPLDPEADPEYVRSLREMARSQMTEIIKELGVVGLPSILRIDTYFGILLGQNPAQINSNPVQFDPDLITGTLGTLRDTYGIYFEGNPFNNSVEDEQDITNFRVISDYMTSLMQSWIANRQFFIVDPNRLAFFGTQLVLISRQFNVIAETVNEVRFALDSVFIGPNERQTLLLQFTDPNLLPAMFLEDVLEEVENFATNEGPRLLKDGGKISVTNNILPVMNTLKNLIQQAHEPANFNDLPDGYKTTRVRNSLDDLQDQIEALINLTEQVEQQVPPPEGKPIINSVSVSSEGSFATVSVFGDQFDSAVQAEVFSTATVGLPTSITFWSSQRFDAFFDASPLDPGNHDIVVTNPDGQSTTFTDAFSWDGTTVGPALNRPASAGKAKFVSKSQVRRAAPVRRKTALSVHGQPVPPTPRPPVPTGKTPAPDLTPRVPELQKRLTDQEKELAILRQALKAEASAPSGSGTPVASGPAPAGAPGTAAGEPALAQQFTVLQDKHEALRQGLADLQTSHSALSQKIEDTQKNVQDTLANHLVEAKNIHASFMEEVRGLLGKIPGLGDSKRTRGARDE